MGAWYITNHYNFRTNCCRTFSLLLCRNSLIFISYEKISKNYFCLKNYVFKMMTLILNTIFQANFKITDFLLGHGWGNFSCYTLYVGPKVCCNCLTLMMLTLRLVQTMEHVPRHSLTRQPRTWCSLVWTVRKHAANMLWICSEAEL